MATIAELNPLNDEHLKQINTALEQLERAKVQINMAKSAGIDVSAEEASVLESERRLRSIRQVYFPGRAA